MDTREFTPHTYGFLPGERCDIRSRLIDDAPKPATARPASKPAPAKSSSSTPTTAAAATATPTPKPAKRDDAPAAKPSPKASGDAPHAAATDSARGASGAGAAPKQKPKSKPEADPKPAPTDTAGDARDAHKAAAHAPSPTTSADSYVAQLEARAKQAKLDQQRDAATIDAAVTPEQRAKLQAEQDAFQGIDRSKATPAPDPSGPTGPGRTATPKQADPAEPKPAGPKQADPKPADPKPGDPPNAARADASASGGGIGGAIATAVGGPTPTVDHTQEQWVEFLRGRDYWVGDDGEVWRVEVDDHGGAALYRNDDPDGSVRPPRIGTSAAGPPPSETTKHPEQQDDDSHDIAADHAAHDAEHGFELPERPTTAQQVQEIMDSPATPSQDTLPPADRTSASGATYLLPDNRTVTSTEVQEHWDTGIERTSVQRSAISDQLDEIGSERSITTRATRPDGSRAIVVTGSAVGSYAHSDEADAGSASSLPVSSYSTSTVIDADGTRHSTDSRRPSPRPTPTTVEELRATQDELGTAYAAASGTIDRPTDPLEGVFHDAQVRMATIDADELQRATREGARNIAKDDPEAMEAYADSTFEDVRAAYARFGLDAAAGNEDIDRTWLSDDADVRSNAYYSRATDSMKFGKLEDGTPFASSDDVIAHEFAHRITQKNGGVNYEGESGAINESLSDTMAAAVDTEDWLVGEDIEPGGIRDMSDQHTMADFKETKSDHGGVHTNSAIPNYAAYLIGDELGREDMGRIYARTMDQYLSPDMQFTDLARGTWRAAVDLYGENSREAAAVRDAWDGVLELNGATDIYDQQDVGAGGGGGTAGGW